VNNTQCSNSTPKVSRFTDCFKWKFTITQYKEEKLLLFKTEDSLTEIWEKILVGEVYKDKHGLIQRLVSCRLKPEDFFNQGFTGALSEEFPEVSHVLTNLEQLRILQEENLWIESASWIEN
jgi:hypothetical protein